ncbi:MAG: urea transporter [Polyangiales bacterium]
MTSGLAAVDRISVVEIGDSTLRGIGQVVLQNNPWTGLVILAAICVNSWIYGTLCLLGALLATLTAVVFGADRGAIRAGLHGFNGALVAIALDAYTSSNYTAGTIPGWQLITLTVFAVVLSVFVAMAIGKFTSLVGLPALTASFIVVSLVFVSGALAVPMIESAPLEAPAFANPEELAAPYTLATFLEGSGKGVGQVFLQDNYITGALILVGIAINTRIGALMALLGCVLSTGIAMALGYPEANIHAGLYGYNGVLTAIALGGLFFVLTWRSFLFTMLGVVLTFEVTAGLATILTRVGLPVYTASFVLVTWVLLAAGQSARTLRYVMPADATTPEEILRAQGKPPF